MAEREREAEAGSAGKLGTFAGVFTPSILTILGIILFLRMGYVVGNAGIYKTILILGIATFISVLTSLSLSAIATNIRVKGGGDYFLISRTLGFSFGGALGIVLFLAQSVSIAFYAIGFGEALANIVGVSGYWPQIIAVIASFAIFGLAWKGADWASRFQYVVMGILCAALLSFFVGAIGKFSGKTYDANIVHTVSQTKGVSFWIIFAIFFPAVTGFTQGVSMSGDLEDPGKSLPQGTFAAVGVSTLVYLAVAILLAGTLPATTMITKSSAMKHVAWIGWLIDAGVIAATLSSAMASFLGAPRILQALASDKIFTFLNPFAQGEGPSNNPRRGVLLSGGIALVVIAIGNLNVIAPIVSMFFLISYGLLNYATFFEADAASPSFRPRFRWFNKWLSLVGAFACVAVMIAINPTAGGVALIVLFAIFQFLRSSKSIERWTDSSTAHHFQKARSHLWAMSRTVEHPRDWRPKMLVYAEDPPRRARLLHFASWIEGNSGLTAAVRILEGSGASVRKQKAVALTELKKEITKLGVSAYPLVVTAPEKHEATKLIVQSFGVGPMQANTVLFNWLEDAEEGPARMFRYGQTLRNQIRHGANVALLKTEDGHWAQLNNTRPKDRRIDVWWSDNASSRLMLLMAYLFTRTEAWEGAKLRILAPCEKAGEHESVLQHLHKMLEDVRIDAAPIVLSNIDAEVVRRQSKDASIVFLPMQIKQNLPTTPVAEDLVALLEDLNTVGLVLAAKEIELDADPDGGPLKELTEARDAAEEAAKKAQKAEEAASAASERVEKLKEKQEELQSEKEKVEEELKQDLPAEKVDSIELTSDAQAPELEAEIIEKVEKVEKVEEELKELEDQLEEAQQEAQETFKKSAKAKAKAEHSAAAADELAEQITPVAKAMEELKQEQTETDEPEQTEELEKEPTPEEPSSEKTSK